MPTLRDLEPRAKEILASERVTYERGNPRSREAFERSCRVLPGGVSRTLCYFPPFPCQTAAGDDCWVTDLDGNRRLDLFNCATTLILGHRPAIVMKAEEALPISISDEELRHFRTLGDVRQFVERQLAVEGPPSVAPSTAPA